MLAVVFQRGGMFSIGPLLMKEEGRIPVLLKGAKTALSPLRTFKL